jgi:PqqD family protein of HPr-rel-A system
MNTWSCAVPDRLLVRSWSGEEGVVYDTLSGDTHLLEPLALELLRQLVTGVPRSARALLDELADLIEDTAPASALAAIEQSLESMRRAGLVVASAA